MENLNRNRHLSTTKLKIRVKKQVDIDLNIIVDKIFLSKRFCYIQKYLKCIEKPSVLPATVKFGEEKHSKRSVFSNCSLNICITAKNLMKGFTVKAKKKFF